MDRRRLGHTLGAVLLLVAPLLTACSGDDSESREQPALVLTADQLAAQGVPGPLHCPRSVAAGSHHGRVGWTDRDATRPPTLAAPETGILCEYWDDRDFTRLVRQGPARRLTRAQLTSLPLDRLRPHRGPLFCTAEAGPTWLLLYRHDGRVVTVTADGFGCRWVRLTDDLGTVEPGASTVPGLSRGVLDGGDLATRLCRLWDVDHTERCR